VASTSGDIRGTAITRLGEATSMSGRIDLAGTFGANAEVRSTSGDVVLHLAPGSSVGIDARSTSGSVRANALSLTNRSQDARSLSGTFGSGTSHLLVRTTSGDITLTSEP
jgi:DUF4097 and DUF4098 domain-containing protein YvlB